MSARKRLSLAIILLTIAMPGWAQTPIGTPDIPAKICCAEQACRATRIWVGTNCRSRSISAAVAIAQASNTPTQSPRVMRECIATGSGLLLVIIPDESTVDKVGAAGHIGSVV